jgi:hypothetical protein
MRNVSDKRCRENKNTHFTFKNLFFFRTSSVNEMTSKNMVETLGPQMTSKHGAKALSAG